MRNVVFAVALACTGMSPDIANAEIVGSPYVVPKPEPRQQVHLDDAIIFFGIPVFVGSAFFVFGLATAPARKRRRAERRIPRAIVV